MTDSKSFDAISAMEQAQVTPAFEYMRDATPAMMSYAMSCYLDGLVQGGMSSEQAVAKATAAAVDAIRDAASELSASSYGPKAACGASFELPASDGSVECNYEYTYTTDGKTWHSVLFETLEDAREYATQIVAENEENPRFMSLARRMVLVSLSDFMDSSKSAVDLAVLSKVTTIL